MASFSFTGGWLGTLSQLGRGRRSGQAADGENRLRRLHLEPLEERTLLSVTLTSNGAATSTIVVAPQPTVTAAYAAAELQSDLKQISGATVPIVTAGQPVSGAAIDVGDSAATEALGYSNSSFSSQQYLIDYDNPSNSLVLMGNDSPEMANGGAATVYGAPSTVTGQFGNALSFSGADALTIANSGFNDSAGSLECWVNFSGTSGNNNGTILQIGGANSSTYQAIERVNGNQVMYAVYNGTSTNYVDSTSTTLTGWHSILATHSTTSGTMQLYIDGVSQGTAAYTTATSCAGQQLCVGAFVNGGVASNGLSGAIDEVRVSSSVRTGTGAAPTQAPTVDSTTTCLLHLDADTCSGAVTTLGDNPAGTCSGAVTTIGDNPVGVIGRFGTAEQFDGAGGLLVASPGFTDAVGSLECWVNFSGTGGNENGTIMRIDSPSYPTWTYHILERINGNGVAYLVYNGTNVYALYSTSTTLTGWHHVLATHSTTTGKMQLFIDGVSQGTAAYTTATTCAGQPLSVGVYNDAGMALEGLEGSIDEVRVSSSVRNYGGSAPTAAPTADSTTTCLLHFGADSAAVTAYGNPVVAAGNFNGTAVRFGGADAVTMTSPGFNDSAGSLECWVDFSGISNDNGTILRINNTSSSSYHIIDRISGCVRYRYYNSSTGIGYSVTSSVLTAGWHSILATHSTTSGLIQLFIDGVSQGTAAYHATTCAGAKLCIGGYVSGSTVSNGFLGSIDDVRVSSSVRSYGGVAPTAPPVVDSTTTGLLLFNTNDPAVQTYGDAGASTTTVSGEFDGAQQFAGDEALSVPDCGFNDNVGSLECWVDFTGTGGNEQGTILRVEGSSPTTYHLIERINGNGVGYVVYDGTNTYAVYSTSTTLTGWHSILATHSITTGTIQLFIDGVSQGTAPYTTATTCACGKLPGDTNGDGAVNGTDLNTVLSNYNKTGMGWNGGDFNGDGVVNGADLNTVLSNYNKTGFIYTNSPLYVGGYVNAASGVTNGLAGSICEVRVSTSIRNYGGTAPTVAPTADGATTCLLHLYSLGGAPLEEFILSQLNLASVPLPGLYDAQATAYAVYDFLEEYCGVCWFNPTATGSVYPSTPTLTVSVTNAMRTLSYESRIITSTFVNELSATNDEYNSGVETLWTYGSAGYETYIAAAYPSESTAQITRAVQLFEARMCLGGMADTCNHSLYGYYDRFVATHPEWFIDPTNPSSQLDYTNPAVIAQVAQDAADYYDGLETGVGMGYSFLTDCNPFVVTPMDNANFTPADYYSGTVTSYGSPAQVTGYFGNATSFSGTAAITAASAGFSDSIGSLECWVNFSGTGNAGGTILRLDGTTGWTSYQLISRTSSGCVMYSIYNSNTGATYSVTSSVLTAGWHSILATHSTTSSTIQLFIDGVSQGTAAYYATSCANMTLCIGGQVSGSTVSNGFVGSIEEVRVSSSVRSDGGVAPIQPPAADSSTTLLLQCNASTVTMYGNPQYVVGYSYSGSSPGSAVQFAGSDALTAVNPGFNDSIGSMECWVDFSGTGNAGGTILRLDGTTGWTSYQLISRTSSGCVMYSIYNSNTGATYSVTSSVLTAGWHSILATHSTTSGTIQLFIDGVSQGTAAYYATTCAGSMLCIGGQMIGRLVRNGFVGAVDEIRISSSVRNYGGAAPTAPPTADGSTTCLLHLNGEGLPQTDTSGEFTNGADSDYWFNFVNQVVAVLHAMPGHQNDPVSTFAYCNWGAVPTHVTLNPSIEVQFCFQCNRMPYYPVTYSHEMGYVEAWQSEAAVSGRKLGLWLYDGFPLWDTIPLYNGGNTWECFPGYFADTLAQQFSIFGDSFSTLYYCGWGQEVEAYITFRLMANSSLDVPTLLNNYFTEMYGTSAGPIMQSIYDLIENTYLNTANYPPGTATATWNTHTNQSTAWGWLGTADVMAQLQSLMNQAISAAGTNNTYATNVNLFNLGTWQYMLAGRNQYLTTANPPTASITSPATGTIVTGVSISASAIANNGGSIADVYFYADGTLLGTDTSSPYSYTWANATPGSHVLKVVAVDNQGDATTSTAVDVMVWSHADVGAVGTVGSDSYNVGNAQFTVNGAGTGVTGTADAFRFVYQSLSGNFTITAEVNSFNGATAAAGAGVMMRQNITSAGAIEASLLFNPYSNLASFNQRTTASGSTSATTSSTTGTSYWVQLVRNGTTVQAFMSSNGTTWTQVGSNATVSMTDPVLVGLAVTSGTTSSTNQAIFSNVVISQTSGSDVVMAAAASDDAPLTQGLMVTPLSLSVPEGGTAQFTVRLDTQPASDVTVAIAKQSGGDADLSAAAASLTFTSANWNTPQPVTLSAAQDSDAIDGTANFLISSTGLTDQTLTATEQDDDAGGTGTAATYVAPTFSVVGPTAGTYQAGNAVAIQWTAGGVISGGKISLCYDTDTAFNGNEHWIEINGVPASNSGGTYTWNTAGVAPGTYYIAGYMYDGGKTFTFSHLKQAIAVTAAAPQTFAVTGPTSGTYQAGQTVNIAWTAGNVKSGSKISLCYDDDAKWWNGNEHWIEIDGVAAANGSYSYAWDTSGVQPGTYYVGGYLWNGGKTFAFSHLAQSINIAAALTLAAPEEPVPASLPSIAVLESQSELTPIVNEAMQRLAHATGSAVLANVSVEIADLPGMLLGEDIGNKIIIDRNAAGYGWFVDPTPADDVEFSDVLGPYALAAVDGSPAAHRADLLTAVMHEMGHLLGYDHDAGDDLMNATLPLGERRFLAEGVPNSPGLASDGGVLDDIFTSSNDDGNEKWS